VRLQWLQNPSEVSGDNLNNTSHEIFRYYKNEGREYIRDVINEAATNERYNQRPANLFKSEECRLLGC
jgi:hypothetical protein